LFLVDLSLPVGGTSLGAAPSLLAAYAAAADGLRHRARHIVWGVMASMLLLVSGMWPGLAGAEEVPWRKQHFDLRANNEPLNTFLARVLTLNGIAATMSPPIASGKVNGRLQGSAETIFRELADTYGLTWYYDGSMLYIYSLSEVESRMLQVSPGDVPRVERTLREMRLLDARYTLKTSATEGQVLVSGPPQYVNMVSSVVAHVANAPSQSPQQIDVRVFRLRHARAVDTVVTIAGVETTIPGVARILNETLGASAYLTDAGGPPARTVPVTVPGLRGKGLQAIGRESSATGASARGMVPAPTVPSAPSSLASGGESTVAPERDAARANPSASAPGREAATATVQGPMAGAAAVARADPRINAVIVRDTSERMPMYARLIEQLDVATPLLEIEATVIDVSHDKSEQLGIDWRAHGQRADIVSSPNGLAGTGQGTRNDANDLLFALPAQSAGTGLVGTLLFGSERTNFVARLNALTEKGDANLISKPRVLTLDNTEAVLQSTRDFYVRVAGREQVDLFNVTLGLVLRVTPTLIEDNRGARVKLNIRIEDGNTNGAQVDQIPVVSRNAISTQAVVGDGQTLLIGGYAIEEKNHNDSGVPWLSEIPGLRWLFGQKATVNKRVERIFMITPRLLKPEEMNKVAAVSAPATQQTAADALVKGEVQ